MTEKVLIGIDTNILARYILQDDAKQFKIASDFLESLTEQKQGYISKIVLAELIWLLQQGYKLPRAVISEILEKLLTTDSLYFEDKAFAEQALKKYSQSTADFPDLLIAITTKNAGCAQTVTFDKKASKQADMVLITKYGG